MNKQILSIKPALFITLFVGITSLVSLFVILSAMNASMNQPLIISEEKTFDVVKGASLKSVVNAFSEKGFIENSFWLKLSLRLNGQQFNIKTGHYALLDNATLEQQLQLFSSGNVKTYLITMVEGQIWKEWYRQLQQATFLKQDMTESQLVSYLNPQSNSLEGLLLPETYAVNWQTPLSEFVLRMKKAMQEYVEEQWLERQGMLPLNSQYEALILASIVEKETGVSEERPHIASVFVNRLRDGMRLQTDPTVIYGIGEAFDGDIKRVHLRQKTPYNTYVIKGLPPTPIAMPGKAAIFATLNPAFTEDYYFVAKGDGTHQFSQNLQQHNAAVRKYQLGL